MAGVRVGMTIFEMPVPEPGITVVIRILIQVLICAYFFNFYETIQSLVR